MKTKVYACINRNEEERARSSSGGVYPLIARKIIEQGGSVFAACYNDELEVVHTEIVSLEGLFQSQGSKYVCSKIGDTFRTIGETVKSEKLVLFVGTPCQCAGLISFLNTSHINWERYLYIVDFICHGVPGKLVWAEYRKSLQKRGRALISINMRDKTSGWSRGNYSWKETSKDGREIITPRRQVTYMKGMLSNLYLRPSCYKCFFKGIDRDTDFTLGDYWEVWNHIPDMDDNRGTSLLLIHSDKANSLFETIRESLVVADTTIESALAGNMCIMQSASRNPNREEFFRRLHRGEDFMTVVDDLTKSTILRKIKRIMITGIRVLHNTLGIDE